ncbi:hypothetical protein EX30DRAFT_344890 [Ascodesmis nigricans]|uniref:Sister chromatid cohesion protein Ctf8 n=1 Tax=Ascodesmis nigricans TaxID=341454 RepID=A0A4V3SHJ6_9PEZI|nr:hypothetical protein EX30DRAFT_344890 [Ascodesmis nigricans]
MPSIPLHPPPQPTTPHPSPLPQLLHTPSGLALLEIQGTLNISPDTISASDADSVTTEFGRILFPSDEERQRGDKRVWMFVGKHQRLLGKCVELKVPMGVLRRKKKEKEDGEGAAVEELEVVEIVRWKVVFASRPEPV